MYVEKKCKITFVAHGATIYSEEDKISDIENYPPLSDYGVDQVNNIVSFFKARAINNDVIYSSSSIRTRQTAHIISKLFKQDYIVLDDLKTRKCGNWQGTTYLKLLKQNQNFVDDLIHNNLLDKVGGAENFVDFYKRVADSIRKLVEENIGNRIIVVTYPDVIAAAICTSLNLPVSNMINFYIPTGSLTQISYYDNYAGLVYSGCLPPGASITTDKAKFPILY